MINVCDPKCEERSATCHGTCERYLTARQQHMKRVKEINNKKYGDKDYRDYVIDSKAKVANRVRSQHRRKKVHKHEV